MVVKDKVFIIDRRLLPRTEEEKRTEVVGFIKAQLEDYRLARSELEDIWLESWAAYVGSPEALEHQRNQRIEIIGNVSTNWRHKINVGKAYEIVETVVGYLAAAIFPNKDWMTLIPENPMEVKFARLMRKYFSDCLDDWRFKSKFISTLRQMAITGSTVFICPWDADNNRITYDTLDVFDVYIDASASDSSESNIIRRQVMSRVDVLRNIRTGMYTNIKEEDVISICGDDVVYSDNSSIVKKFQGLDTEVSYSMYDKLNVWEFWGDVQLQGVCYHDHYAVVVGDKLVRFEPNPYEGGKPIIIGDYTPVVRQPHGMSSFQPALGLMHVLNSITNQRLDNVELAINTMFKKKASSILRTEEVVSEPGRVLEVTDMDDLEPLIPNTSNLVVSYQEAGTIQAQVEQTTGTGPLVSTGQPRGGERVTAQEVQMVREAGSNRLSTVHRHIEDTLLIPILQRSLDNIRQFIKGKRVVRIANTTRSDSYDYYEITPSDIKSYQYRLKPRGADYIVEQREYIQKRTAFVQLVVSVPQFAEKIDFDRVLHDLLQNWGFEEPEAYMKSPTPEQGQPVTTAGSLEEMGGAGLVNAANEQLAVDGGSDALSRLTGQQLPEGVNANDLLQQYFSSRTALDSVPLADAGAAVEQ